MARIISALVLSACMIISGSALAGDSGQFMPVGETARAPIGHRDYCRRDPDDCVPTQIAPRLHLDRATMTMLREVGKTINRSIEAASDRAIWDMEEYWTLPSGDVRKGDCEDYALAKRRTLRQSGIDTSNLLMTVVKRPNGEGHAVLVVTTDAGDYVLDNLDDRVLRWDRTPYSFSKRQKAGVPEQWVSVGVETAGFLRVASTPGR